MNIEEERQNGGISKIEQRREIIRANDPASEKLYYS